MTTSAGGRRSRRKGHQFEREMAIALRKIFPGARRQLEYHSRDARGVDLQETGPYRIQCKKLQKYAPIERIFEVQYDCREEVPVLITAGDSRPPMVVLPLTEFLRLLETASSVAALNFY